MNKTPSLWYCALNFATAIFSATLLIAYEGAIAKIMIYNKINIRMDSRDSNNLFCLSAENQGSKDIKEVYLRNYIYFKVK
jgi:hypothetical protein